MSEEKFNYNEMTMLGGPPTKPTTPVNKVEDTGLHLKDCVSDYATGKPDMILSLGNNSNQQQKVSTQSQPKPQIAEPSEQIVWDTTPQQTQRGNNSTHVYSNMSMKTKWAWAWIVVIVLSVITLFGGSKISSEIVTNAFAETLLYGDATAHEEAQALGTLIDFAAQALRATIILIPTILFCTTCKKRGWDSKAHGTTMLIIACVFACLGWGLISEILILLAAIRIFRQAKLEKQMYF